MTLAEQLQAGMTAAMRAHDDVRRDALRMALAALRRAEKDARRPLTPDEELAVMAREVRTRRESVEAFAAGGRSDLAAAEERKLEALAGWMPTPLTGPELDRLVAQAIAEAGATTPRDTGRVMQLLAPQVRGRADGRALSQRVASQLGGGAVPPASTAAPQEPAPPAAAGPGTGRLPPPGARGRSGGGGD
ncbi:MAG: GatB/YqeY domain-containing protein [Candidatus Limnocylindrales bacterium]